MKNYHSQTSNKKRGKTSKVLFRKIPLGNLNSFDVLPRGNQVSESLNPKKANMNI